MQMAGQAFLGFGSVIPEASSACLTTVAGSMRTSGVNGRLEEGALISRSRPGCADRQWWLSGRATTAAPREDGAPLEEARWPPMLIALFGVTAGVNGLDRRLRTVTRAGRRRWAESDIAQTSSSSARRCYAPVEGMAAALR